MLKCKEIVDKSSAYVDNQLSLRDKLSFRMHVFMCVHCRRFMRQLKLMIASAPNIKSQTLSDEEVELVMRRIRANNNNN